MLFFVLPITFFVAAVATLTNLSKEYELPVLFSLGFTPKALFRVFAPLCFLLSIILFIFSFILIPSSNELYSSFLNQKRQNLDLNLEPGDFAQKLGAWLVYVGEKDGQSYQNVVLFSKNALDKEAFVIAEKIELHNSNSALELLIFDGSIFLNNIDDIAKIDYEKMISRFSFASEQGSPSFIDYWLRIGDIHILERTFDDSRRVVEGKKVLRNLSTYLLVSLFPIMSLAFIPLLGVMHPRFAHSYTYILLLAVIGVFYGCVHGVSTYFPLSGIIPMILLWSCGAYWLYRRKIARIY